MSSWDRIAALGVITDYDRIGLKPDQREINSPPVTAHQIAVVQEQCSDSSSILRTNYVGFPSSPSGYPSTEDMAQTLNLESGSGPDLLGTPGARTAKIGSSSTPGSQIGQGSDLNPPTHLRESWIRGSWTTGLYPLAGLLDYEDTRLKTSSHVRMGLSLAWKASLAIQDM